VRDEVLRRAAAALLHCFASKVTWTRQANGTWKSSGGRVLSDASYQKIRSKAARAKGKAAPAAAPKAAGKPSPGPEANARATPRPGLSRKRTEVRGRPIVASAHRPGDTAERPAPAAKAVAPKADGTPDFAALKAAVDDGVESNRANRWGIDLAKARAQLADASKQIDDWARRNPRKVAPLAREVTGKETDSTQDAVKLLKAWVGETVAILAREPSHLDRRPGAKSTGFSERAEWRGRLEGAAKLLAALAA
jgi:hypothetical protein